MECKEIFLSDIIKVDIYEPDSFVSPLPSTIPCSEVQGVIKSNPILSYAYSEDAMALARPDSISVKQTSRQYGASLIYIYNVDAVLISNFEGVKDDTLDALISMDCNVILTKADGSLILLSSLPNSFSVDSTDNLHELTLKISLSSMSSFPKVTSLRQEGLTT